MAVFTTELRTLCGALAGDSEHACYGGIDEVIGRCWNQVFSGSWNTYDPAYKEVLCRKILKHYWMREIGTETTDLFLHYLNTRLDEIMPYYNDLYKSAQMEFDPLHDYDLQTTSTRTTDGETSDTSVVNGTTTANGNNRTESTVKTDETGQNITKFSDTPQGELSGVLDGTYLTNATVVDSTSNGNEERSGESTRTENQTNESTANNTGTAKTTEDYILSVKGKSGGKSYSALLTEYRKTLINIDVMIIDDLKDLFMGLWF